MVWEKEKNNNDNNHTSRAVLLKTHNVDERVTQITAVFYQRPNCKNERICSSETYKLTSRMVEIVSWSRPMIQNI